MLNVPLPTGSPVYLVKPSLHLRSATSATAVLTASGARKYTSTRWGVEQSTTFTPTTFGSSTGGGSARQSPTSRSNQFTVRAAGVGDGGGTLVVTAVTAGAEVGSVVGFDGLAPHAVNDASATNPA